METSQSPKPQNLFSYYALIWIHLYCIIINYMYVCTVCNR